MKNRIELRDDYAVIHVTGKGGPYEFLIDVSDVTLLREFGRSWYSNRSGSNRYAYASVPADKVRRSVFLHQLIIGNVKGKVIDHINRDTFDNRRSNLRHVTHAQNLQNVAVARSDSRLGVKNVGFRKGKKNPYQVRIAIPGGVNGKRFHKCFGCYSTLEEAAAVASHVRQRYHSHSPENSEVAP